MVANRKYDRTLNGQGLMLAKNEQGKPLWEVGPAPGLAPSYNPGEASYLNASPQDDLVVLETDWREGMASGGYGGDTRFKGRIHATPAVTAVAYVATTSPTATDGGLETWTDANTLTNWTKAGAGTLDKDGALFHGGSFSAKWTASGGAGTNTLQQSLGGAGLIGQTISCVSAWCYSTGVGRCSLKLYRNGVAIGGVYTVSNAGTSAWEQLTLPNYLVSAGTTDVTISLETTDASGGVTNNWDDVSCTVPATLGQTVTGGLVAFGANLYLATANGIFKCSGTNWTPMLVKSGCTGIAAGTDYMLAAFGSTVPYFYSADGTTWTQFVGAALYATYFGAVTTSSGETYYKGLGRALMSTANPINGGTAWGGSVNIGWASSNFTALVSYQNQLFVLKPEGGFYYDTTLAAWSPFSRELETLYNANTGQNAFGWKSYLYVPVGVASLYQYDPVNLVLDTVTPGPFLPSDPAFGGQCQALAGDDEYLFAFLDNSTKTELLAGRYETIGSTTAWVWHPLVTATYGTVYAALATAVVTAKRLWFAGGSSDTPSYADLPSTYSDIPHLSGYTMATSWTHYTPRTWGKFPDADKAWVYLVVKSTDLAAGSVTIAVSYSTDGLPASSGSKTWTSLGTLNTSPSQTLTFSTAVSAKEIQFKFVSTNTSSATGVIEAIALHGLLRPLAKREYRFSVYVGDNLTTRDGSQDRSISGKQLATNLRAAYTVLPVTLTDEWEVSHTVVLTGPPVESTTLKEVQTNVAEVWTITARDAIGT